MTEKEWNSIKDLFMDSFFGCQELQVENIAQYGMLMAEFKKRLYDDLIYTAPDAPEQQKINAVRRIFFRFEKEVFGLV